MNAYSSLALTATRLLDRYGVPVYLTFAESSTYDPASGTATNAEYEYTGVGVKLDYTVKEIDGTSILRTDQRVYMAPNISVVPMTGNKLMIGREVYTVIKSSPLDPGGVNLLFDIQVRK